MPNTIATGVAFADPEFTTCYASQEIGYAAAAQGAVTQLTSKATAVTLNKSAGRITMHNASLSNGAIISFTLNNSMISAKDTLIVNVSGGLATNGTYIAMVSNLAAGAAVLSLYNISAGPLSEAVVLNFAVIHGA
jgi:hypothetical protein